MLKHILLVVLTLSINPSFASQDSLFYEHNVQEPTLGPVLGKPTEDSIKLWIRGPVLQEDEDSLFYFGVLNLKKESDAEWPKTPVVFPLKVHYDVPGVKSRKDYTGITAHIPIEPGTYVYQMGYVTHNSQDLPLLSKFTWGHNTYRFTIRDPAATNSSLAFGSCRYFARIWGFYPWLGRSDRIFQHISQVAEQTDAFALIGDFIYGDYFNLFGQSRSYEDFMVLYEKAMATPYFRQVLASIPCAFTLDDHEVSNNFGATYEQDHPDIWKAGMAAYMTYQHMISPGFVHEVGLNHEGYPMMIGNVPAFMMNARSNRSVTPPRIISENEMIAVKQWLNYNQTSSFKVLLTSVPIFPIYANNQGQDDDKWMGYPDQMMELLSHIDQNHISGVVICSGDIHKSLYAQINTPRGITITTVIASPFFSPWGHDEGPTADLQTERDDIVDFVPGYSYVSRSQVYHEDSFGRLEFLPNSTLLIKLINTAGVWINEHDPAGHQYVLAPAARQFLPMLPGNICQSHQ